MGAALLWAHYSEIDITVNAEGKVVSGSHLQIVQHLEGGIVSKIFVKEGEIVRKDQILVEMDDTRFKSEYDEKKTRLWVLQTEIYRLSAEANGDAHIYFPKKLYTEAPEIIEHALIVFNKNKKSFEKSLSILEEACTVQRRIQYCGTTSSQRHYVRSRINPS